MKFLENIVAYFKAKQTVASHKRRLDNCAFANRRKDIINKLGADLSPNDPNLFNKIETRIELVFQQSLADLVWLECLSAYSNKIQPKIIGLEFLINLRPAELCIPNIFTIENTIHLNFADRIVMDYASFRGKDSPYTKCVIKPEGILPYPKSVIISAGDHYLECIASGKYDEIFDKVVKNKLNEKLKTKYDLHQIVQVLLNGLEDEFIPVNTREIPEDINENYNFYIKYYQSPSNLS